MQQEETGVGRHAGFGSPVLPETVFQPVLRASNPRPDLIVDFSFARCAAGAGPIPSTCQDDGTCLHRRYLPGDTAYQVGHSYFE